MTLSQFLSEERLFLLTVWIPTPISCSKVVQKSEFPQVHGCYATCQEAYLLNLSPWRNLIFGCANAHSVDPERVRTILTKLPLNLDSKGNVFILNMKDDVLHTPHK